ncbi:MAG: hypothetical protein JW841_13030 [Deltaproteobacteria bacterium]|nr:hypothetical protein [Deltaproteobacteria bacterium]
MTQLILTTPKNLFNEELLARRLAIASLVILEATGAKQARIDASRPDDLHVCFNVSWSS